MKATLQQSLSPRVAAGVVLGLALVVGLVTLQRRRGEAPEPIEMPAVMGEYQGEDGWGPGAHPSEATLEAQAAAGGQAAMLAEEQRRNAAFGASR